MKVGLTYADCNATCVRCGIEHDARREYEPGELDRAEHTTLYRLAPSPVVICGDCARVLYEFAFGRELLQRSVVDELLEKLEARRDALVTP